MAEALWTGVAHAYARSFAGLCAGAIPLLLDDLPGGGRLLDVGCGTGALVQAARSRGHDAVGVEPDAEMVELPEVETFVADVTDGANGAGVVARLRTGKVVSVDAEGEVETLDEAPEDLDEVPLAPPVRGMGPYDVLVESVPMAGGGWAHLVDSARRAGAEEELRQSETGRRAVIVCPTESTCAAPVTIDVGGTVRLR